MLKTELNQDHMQGNYYAWKLDTEATTTKDLKTCRPLMEGNVLVDLYDGQKYLVQRVYDVPPSEKLYPTAPDLAIETRTLGVIAEDQLKELRNKKGYALDYHFIRFNDVAFG